MSDGFNDIIHVPTRLRLCSILAEVGEAEFGFFMDLSQARAGERSGTSAGRTG